MRTSPNNTLSLLCLLLGFLPSSCSQGGADGALDAGVDARGVLVMTSEQEPGTERRSHLRKIRFRGRLLWMALAGVLVGSVGLFLVTGLADSPWLFLLYPLLIGLIGVALLVLAIQFLHRL